MDPVSMLLFNALVRHQSINLPELGSLTVQQSSARLKGGKMLTAPIRRVVFDPTEQEGFESILNLIALSSGKDPERCNAIYQSWLKSVRTETEVRIPTVGMIAEGRFRPTEELNRIMNPFPTTARKVKRQGRKNGLVWMVLIGVVVALGVAAGYLFYTGRIDAESRSEELTQAKETLQKTAVSAESLDSLAQEGVVAAEPATPAESIPTPTPVNNSSTHYYVVVGLYSTPENADRFIAESRTKHPNLNYGKLPQRTGRIMIYIADEPTSEQAESVQQAYLHAFPEAWILKKP